MASINRSLYGLKQLRRCWYTSIKAILIGKIGSCHRRCDYCLYTFEHGIVLSLYVNNILITCISKIIYHVRQQLKAKLYQVDLGPIGQLLGMIITRKVEERHINILQQGYLN